MLQKEWEGDKKMSRIILKNINKYYNKVHVLKDINLVVEDGDFMTLLGPSGCGKTTTLRVIAGLEVPEKGQVIIDDDIVTDTDEAFYVAPSKRGLNLVFQNYALWPHMTVYENVSFGLKVKKVSQREIQSKVEKALKILQIEDYIDRYPSELSGGQQQRVAIARAIVSQPKLLLLDEPLSNLDARLRLEMRAELKRLHQELKTTIIYVTHDQVEALTLSTKIAVFFEGKIVQVDTPMNIYTCPTDVKVADFIGNPKINFIDGICVEDNGKTKVISSLGEMEAVDKTYEDHLNNKEVVLALRPEHIIISDEFKENYFECQVYAVLPAGSETLIQIKKQDKLITAKVIGQTGLVADQKIWISFVRGSINVYDKKFGHLLFNV